MCLYLWVSPNATSGVQIDAHPRRRPSAQVDGGRYLRRRFHTQGVTGTSTCFLHSRVTLIRLRTRCLQTSGASECVLERAQIDRGVYQGDTSGRKPLSESPRIQSRTVFQSTWSRRDGTTTRSTGVRVWLWKTVSLCHARPRVQRRALTPAHPHSRCPGAHLVESSAWLLMVSMMATLDITKAVDEYGVEVEPEVVFDNSVFRYVP